MTIEQRSKILQAVEEAAHISSNSWGLCNVLDADYIPKIQKAVARYAKDRDATALWCDAGSAAESAQSVVDALFFILDKTGEKINEIYDLIRLLPTEDNTDNSEE